ncbi:hypothetical protein [Thermococcus sp. M39]|uniref:hypothetical protein n=1 Tax=Thermococcus sp. M39 TaxID=1638262 RepID=UPI00197F64AC|nr:hypothetical protein [Thermococcus sp. M39]
MSEYVTLTIPLSASGEKARRIYFTSWFSKLVAHRLLSLVKQNPPLVDFHERKFQTIARKQARDILPNRRYIDGMAKLVYSTLQSAKKLGVDIQKLELSDWLLFQCEGEKDKKGNQNIRLYKDKVEVLTFDYSKNPERIMLDIKFPRGYRMVLDRVVELSVSGELAYPARVIVREANFYPHSMHVFGEIQVMIRLDFYHEVMKRFESPLGDNVGGIDVNTDRINLAVVNRSGELLDTYTVWFSEITARGFPKKKAWSLLGESIHKVLKYAYYHGVSTIALENPKVLGYLKYYWIRNGERCGKDYNYKVATFRNSVIEKIVYKAPLYGFDVVFVNPAGTSTGTKALQRKLGLDKHTTSAYLIALRGLKRKKTK